MRNVAGVCRNQENQVVFLDHIATRHGVVPISERFKREVHGLVLLQQSGTSIEIYQVQNRD